MTRETRKILFLILFSVFILFGPVLVIYFQGYRVDFENKRLTQTGGLFLRVAPKQVEIYLDNVFERKTDFFFGSALIENLLPKKYHVEIKKEGYSSWVKDLEIKEREVVEAKNVVLFPEKPNFNILTKGVESFWFSSDGKKVILRENEGNFWTLKLYDLEKNVKSLLLKENDISKLGVVLFDLKFSQDAKEISLEVGLKEQLKYFTLEIEKTPPVPKESKIPSPPPEDVLVFQKVNDEIYYLAKDGYLWKTDASFSLPGEKITEEPFLVQPETAYELSVFPGAIFLREGETLYLFNQETGLFEKFFEKIKGLKISPDNKKLAYFSDSEIWVLFLKEKFSQPTKKASEKLFLIRLSEDIQDVFWLNSDYLVFNAGDKIRIAEIDDRDRINIIEIAEFKNPRIFWNKIDKKLYILSENNLYQSSPLLP